MSLQYCICGSTYQTMVLNYSCGRGQYHNSLATSTSKESVVENLQKYSSFVKARLSNKGKVEEAISSVVFPTRFISIFFVMINNMGSSTIFYQNEDDCFGIYPRMNLVED